MTHRTTSETMVERGTTCPVTPYYDKDGITLYHADCRVALRSIESKSVNCCVTSPPYWGLRDYGHEDQIGLERTPGDYVSTMVEVFREVWRVLRDDGTLWLNLGDTYNSNPSWGRGTSTLQGRPQDQVPGKPAAGWFSHAKTDTLKSKDLVGIPWRVAFALQADGWYLRQDIIWHKPNPMPESVKDRCTKSHEYIFLFSKSERYYFDSDGIAEPAVALSDRLESGPLLYGGNKAAGYGIRIHSGRAAQPRSHKGSKFTKGKTAKHQQNRSQSEESRTNGKHSKSNKQSAGRRVLENLQKARDSGAPHDQPFGETRNKRSVWTVTTKPYSGAHFAVFPPELIEPCVMAGCPEGGVVLDPFLGSGTTAEVAQRNGCRAIGCEINRDYVLLIIDRFKQRNFLSIAGE